MKKKSRMESKIIDEIFCENIKTKLKSEKSKSEKNISANEMNMWDISETNE